jgi:hypothetical protein
VGSTLKSKFCPCSRYCGVSGSGGVAAPIQFHASVAFLRGKEPLARIEQLARIGLDDLEK